VLTFEEIESVKLRFVEASTFTKPDNRPVSVETIAVMDVRELSTEVSVACGREPIVVNEATVEVVLPSWLVEVTRAKYVVRA
jgi:hypothetical protein